MDRSAPTANDIRRQMQRARERVRTEADEVVHGARRLTDWRHYVRRYPWATLGAAAVIGYLVVPRRSTVQNAEAPGARRIHRDQQFAHGGARAPRPSLTGSLVSIAGKVLLRAGIAWAGQKAGRLYADWTAPHTVEVPE